MSGDRFQCLRLEVIKELFPAELQYLADHRYEFLDHGYSEYITLLNENRLSTYHLSAFHRRMLEEQKARQLEEEKANIKTR